MRSHFGLCLVFVAVAALAGCGSKPPLVSLSDTWPSQLPDPDDYGDVTDTWTRRQSLAGQYQEVLELAATFKSPEWRAVHAARDIEYRKLNGAARDQVFSMAHAEMSGPYEIELLVTTWDRRENDLDRGKKSVWRVVLVDEQGNEIEPLEIVKDKRPTFTIRADFPAYGDFATAYIARFPRSTPLLGPNAKLLRLRMSGTRGGVELAWSAQ
ncbi:MAG: hypothetical protein HOV81_13965 [Kofleriaceae bacterium]|nr:hypothetical protein [Kofleriaceae bacterium]